MRALFYTPEDHWSGAARATLHLAHALAARNDEVLVACCAASPLEQVCGRAGIATIAMDGRSLGTRDLRRVLRERDVNVTVVGSERDQLVVSSAVRFAQRGAVLRRVAPFTDIVVGRTGQLAAKLAPAALVVSSDAEVANGPAPQLARGWRLPPLVVPFGVEPNAGGPVEPVSRQELGVPDGGVLIVCQYDPTARVRIATLFRALGLIAPRHPGIRALLVGRGADDQELRLHASALGVSRIVRFMDQTVDIRPIAAAADLAWLVSAGDAGALDCLTFMALGIPVVAERSALTLHYLADGITGLLLPPAEPAYHASSVASLLANADLRATMGRAARGRAEREFPARAMADALRLAVGAAAEIALRRG